MESLPQVTYCSINRTVAAKNAGSTLLDISIAHKIPHLHECGGNGRCTTCRVRVIDGLEGLSPRSGAEAALARKRRWDPSIRLACQTRVTSAVSIQRLVWSSADVSQLQVETAPDGVGEERPLAILFCDIRDFTRIASEHSTFDLVHMLNRFFTTLGDPVLMNNGIIYQYVGDEITGLFGTAGGDPAKVCLDAVRAALGMQYAIERLNRNELRDFGVEFKIGIGLHFGAAIVGHIGHPKHRQFAVVGDAVNVAKRIESQNKELGTQLLVSGELLDRLPPGTLRLGKQAESLLRGKTKPQALAEVTGFEEPDINLEVQATLDILLRDEDRLAKSFYDRLFARSPRLKGLFQTNMLEQGRVFTHMLSGIIYSLSRPEHLFLGLGKLAKQHEGYGVQPDDYPVVRNALLDTIEEMLDDACTPGTRQAWRQAIDLVIEVMIGSQDEDARSSPSV